jgi:hypothetical protein
MEVDVMDDTDKGVKQQDNDSCKHPLLKGQERIVHIGVGLF